MVYRFIDDNKDEYGLRWLCRKFSLSTNAYYTYLKERKNDYRKCKRIILNTIKNIYYDNNRIIGHRGMVIFLKRKGIKLSKTTVHRYMNKELNLHSVAMRTRIRYVRGEKNKVFPNLLNRKFNAEEKNRIWCTDFTYIRLGNGRMRYNCSIIDLYDRTVISSVNSDYINTELAIKTLETALRNERPAEGLILHSDQRCQFTSWAFTDYCKENGIIQSMSRAGCPYDNAPMERFYNTFKNELIYQNIYYSADTLDEAVSHYVFLWYNHVRPHSYNGGLTPFEARHRQK